jgi:hypothetical protein
MRKIKIILGIALGIGISTQVIAATNQDFGTLVGGIAGGLLGNTISHGRGRAAATIGGAVIGSVVGNQVGSDADYRERHRPCYQYTHWETYHHPISTPPVYRKTFIGQDGRLCRYSLLTDEFGDRLYATYCCYRMNPNGYCSRWVQVN